MIHIMINISDGGDDSHDLHIRMVQMMICNN
jgi:hypothetical protein